MPKHVRDYAAIAAALKPMMTHDVAMRAVADVLWDVLHDRGVSWVGFYIDQPDQPDDRRLTLGPCRDKPACSPIGLHGVCGQGLTSQRVRIVRDVAALGENYIACDPRDRSEIVLPLIAATGICWGVLDVDSWDASSFDLVDAHGLQQVLHRAGLAASDAPRI